MEAADTANTMVDTSPESIHDAAARLLQRADRTDARLSHLERSVDALHERITGLDTRTAGIESALLRLDDKFTGEIRRLDAKVEHGLAQLGERLTGNIAKLDDKFTGEIRRLDAKIEHGLAQLDAKLTADIARLDAKFTGEIDKLDAKLTGEIDKLTGEIDKLDAKLTGEIDKIGTTLSSLVEAVAELRTAALLRSDVLERHFVSRGDLQEQLHQQTQRLVGMLIGWSSVLVALTWTIARLMH